MTTIRQDIRYGIRTLKDRSAFTLVATLSLALGIGTNATIFSIINTTLLAPLGLENEDRLVALTTHPLESPGNRNSAAYREFEAWLKAASFEAVGAIWTVPEILGGEGDGTSAAEDLVVIRGGPRLFEVLDVQPQIGRLITPDEDQIDNWAPVALLSNRFWERRFERDPQVVGRTIRLDGVVTTIVGVMPPDLERKVFEPDADLWVPSRTNRAQTISAAGFLTVFARLAPGATVEQARTELNTMARQFAEQYPDSNANRGFGVRRLRDYLLWRRTRTVADPARRRVVRAADRVRQRRGSVARTRSRAADGDRDSQRRRRGPRAADSDYPRPESACRARRKR
jgi:hypothetical protein